MIQFWRTFFRKYSKHAANIWLDHFYRNNISLVSPIKVYYKYLKKKHIHNYYNSQRWVSNFVGLYFNRLKSTELKNCLFSITKKSRLNYEFSIQGLYKKK